MQETNEHAVKLLNSLIETTLDSANGYSEASENSENENFKAMFAERCRKRQALSSQLQQEVRTFGGEPEEHRSMLGRAHNAFVDLKAAVTGRDEKAIINEVERGEDFIKEKFERALEDRELPESARELLSRAYSEIKADHDQVSQMKNSFN